MICHGIKAICQQQSLVCLISLSHIHNTNRLLSITPTPLGGIYALRPRAEISNTRTYIVFLTPPSLTLTVISKKVIYIAL